MTIPWRAGTNSRHAKGFTLLEVLVALVVLSLGLLGTAAMQIDGFRSVQRSVFRTEATLLATEMVERMRANASGAGAGEYVGASAASEVDCNGLANVCSAADMAAFDRARWHAGLRILPGGRGTVVDLGTGRYAVRVRWDEDRRGATGVRCPPLSNDDLRCYELGVSL